MSHVHLYLYECTTLLSLVTPERSSILISRCLSSVCNIGLPRRYLVIYKKHAPHPPPSYSHPLEAIYVLSLNPFTTDSKYPLFDIDMLCVL